MIDEPAFTSTRTDADSYADQALTTMPPNLRAVLNDRRRGYIRDALALAFYTGERQGEFRALWILTIAQQRAHGAEARALIGRCIALLAPDIEGWELGEE